MFTNPPKIMGLDMYLKGTKTFGIYPRGQYKPPFERTFEFQSLLNNHDMENAPIDYDTSWSCYSVQLPLMYWRKSNQIHQWFVQNVQGGKDNCEEYSVSLDQLKLLSKTIEPALVSTAAASELLPTSEGFFFGSQEYDEYYFEDLKTTKKQIDKIIAYQTATENAYKCRCLNLKTYNGTMSTEDFNAKFPTLTKDLPFDDFYYQSSW